MDGHDEHGHGTRTVKLEIEIHVRFSYDKSELVITTNPIRVRQLRLLSRDEQSIDGRTDGKVRAAAGAG